MGKGSKIEWTNHTFNPFWGCVKVSAGCKNCFAEGIAKRFHPDKKYWGPNSERRFFSDNHWAQPIKWNRKAEKEGKRIKVFCGSMCDVLEDRDDLYGPRDDLFNLILNTPNLDWLLLSKRIENAARLLPGLWYETAFPDNVWIGTSVEDQKAADERIHHLLKVPAKVRLLSVEPLLEELTLEYVQVNGEIEFNALTGDHGIIRPHRGRSDNKLDWVIVGGETGPGARRMNPYWARHIRDQCAEAGVKFFMKQMSNREPIPADLLVRQFPEVAK